MTTEQRTCAAVVRLAYAVGGYCGLPLHDDETSACAVCGHAQSGHITARWWRQEYCNDCDADVVLNWKHPFVASRETCDAGHSVAKEHEGTK